VWTDIILSAALLLQLMYKRASYSPDDHVLDFQPLCQLYPKVYLPQEGHLFY